MTSYTSGTVSTSSDYIWVQWTTNSCTATTTSSYCDNTTWSGWNATSTDATCADSTTVSTGESTTVWVRWIGGEPDYQHQQEEIETGHREYERLRQESQKRADDLKKKREKAEQKAKDLLLDLIGEEQLEIYNETGRLLVCGHKYDYIIQKEGFVKRIEKDKIVDLCIHLTNQSKYPDSDNVIALKLLAENNEEEFNRLANNHGEHERPEELLKCACME